MADKDNAEPAYSWDDKTPEMWRESDEGMDMVSTEVKAPSGKPSDPGSIPGISTKPYVPIAIIVRDDDMNIVATTMLEVERILQARYGEEYGITIYDAGDELPTIAFFNNHDSQGE